GRLLCASACSTDCRADCRNPSSPRYENLGKDGIVGGFPPLRKLCRRKGECRGSLDLSQNCLEFRPRPNCFAWSSHFDTRLSTKWEPGSMNRSGCMSVG